MKRAQGQWSTQAASVPLLGHDPEAAKTITLCDAAQACKYLTRPAVVRGSPAPNVEISPQELTTYDAHSGFASCGLVPQHVRVQWRMMICIAPPAHAGEDSLGTPVTHLLQDMLWGVQGVSALGRCCTSSHTCLSLSADTAAVSRTSEWPNGFLCVVLKTRLRSLWGWSHCREVAAFALEGSLWLPWAFSIPAPQGTLEDPVCGPEGVPVTPGYSQAEAASTLVHIGCTLGARHSIVSSQKNLRWNYL